MSLLDWLFSIVNEVNYMNKSVWWAWAIKNSICTICWVVLAIVFNKWWIALFGLLFLSSLRTENTTKNKEGEL